MSTPGPRARFRSVAESAGSEIETSSDARRNDPQRATAAKYSSCSIRTVADYLNNSHRLNGKSYKALAKADLTNPPARSDHSVLKPEHVDRSTGAHRRSSADSDHRAMDPRQRETT